MKNFTYKNEHKINVVADFGFNVYAKNVFDVEKNDTKTIYYMRSLIEANAWHVEAITTDVNECYKNVVEVQLGEADDKKYTRSVRKIEIRKSGIAIKEFLYAKNECNNFLVTSEITETQLHQRLMWRCISVVPKTDRRTRKMIRIMLGFWNSKTRIPQDELIAKRVTLQNLYK